MSMQQIVDGINLDGMDPADLVEFWDKVTKEPNVTAKEIFPSCPKNYVAATKLLAGYALNKSVAMKCRIDGLIQMALHYEAVCDRLYKLLPEFARW